MHRVPKAHHNAVWGGEFIDAVASLSFSGKPGAKPLAYVASALMKCQKVGPRVLDGICRTIGCGSVRSLKSQHLEKAEAAEEGMEKARRICEQTGVPSEKATACVNLFDLRCVVWLLRIKNPFEDRDVDSLE